MSAPVIDNALVQMKALRHAAVYHRQRHKQQDYKCTPMTACSSGSYKRPVALCFSTFVDL
jgi:hypothetical protein